MEFDQLFSKLPTLQFNPKYHFKSNFRGNLISFFPELPILQFNPVKSKTKTTIATPATGPITFFIKDLELFLHLLNTKLYQKQKTHNLNDIGAVSLEI